MPEFRYRAVTEAGEVREGRMQAPNRDALLARLKANDEIPIRAEPVRTGGFAGLFRYEPGTRRGRIAPDAMAAFIADLARLTGAGLSLDAALDLLAAGEPRAAARLAGDLRVAVRRGESLSRAFALVDPSAGRLVHGMLRAGETSGDLAAALGALAGYLARARQAVNALRTALIYPLILTLFAGATLVLLLGYVLPQFAALFRQADRDVPGLTGAMLAFGDFAAAYGWLAVLLGLLAVLALSIAARRARWRRRLSQAVERIPMFGPLRARLDSERIARALATQIAAGVALPEALAVAAEIAAASAVRQRLTAAREAVQQGQALSAALDNVGPVLGPTARRLLRLGEETGRIADLLGEAADAEAQEIAQRTRRLVAWLVPAVTIAIGLIIALMIASLLSATLSLNDLAR